MLKNCTTDLIKSGFIPWSANFIESVGKLEEGIGHFILTFRVIKFTYTWKTILHFLFVITGDRINSSLGCLLSNYTLCDKNYDNKLQSFKER